MITLLKRRDQREGHGMSRQPKITDTVSSPTLAV